MKFNNFSWQLYGFLSGGVGGEVVVILQLPYLHGEENTLPRELMESNS
jgi:hypothetical protein